MVQSLKRSGTNVRVIANNGLTNGNLYLPATANLTLPRARWPVVATNVFDASGHFNFTSPVSAGSPQSLYRLQLPRTGSRAERPAW